jgi:hypothetical protein
MAETKVYGYMLTLKWGTKLIKGLETVGLSIKPNFEPILLKEHNGVEVDDFIDYDADLSISGKTIEMGAEQAATHEDFETLREAASVGAEVAFVYGRMTAGEKTVSGIATIRDWKEDPGSEKKLASWSGSMKVKKGSVTFGVSA